MSFKFGVAVPLKNYSFEEFDRYAELYSGVTSGATEIVLTGDQTVSPVCLQPNNVIEIGPSSDQDWYGTTEKIAIQDISVSGGNTYITLSEMLNADYAAGDLVKIRTVGLGWIGNVGTSSGRYYSRGVGQTENAQSIRYAQKLVYGEGNCDIYQLTKVNTIKSDVVYRLSWYYKLDGASAFVRLIFCKANGSEILTNTKYLVSPKTDWTYEELAVTAPKNSNRAKIQIGMSDVTSLYIDDIVLEHAAKLTTSDSGYIALHEEPDLGSVNWRFREDNIFSKLINRSLVLTNPSRQTLKKIEVSARFSVLNATDYNNLRTLLFFQDLGRQIVFRPDIAGLPKVMIGYISLSFEKTLWDLSKTGVNFNFREA